MDFFFFAYAFSLRISALIHQRKNFKSLAYRARITLSVLSDTDHPPKRATALSFAFIHPPALRSSAHHFSSFGIGKTLDMIISLWLFSCTTHFTDLGADDSQTSGIALLNPQIPLSRFCFLFGLALTAPQIQRCDLH